MNRIGRIAAAAVVSAALVGLGTGVANAADDGTIQEGGHAVSSVEESTGVAQADKEVSDATGVTQIDDETGVTKAEEGLGLG